MDLILISQIVDFLINRSQSVSVNGVCSNVLCPPLQQHINNTHILKFADGTVTATLLEGGVGGHGQVVDDFVGRSDESFLLKKINTRSLTLGSLHITHCQLQLEQLTSRMWGVRGILVCSRPQTVLKLMLMLLPKRFSKGWTFYGKWKLWMSLLI